MSGSLRLHHIVSSSLANGPGRRVVVWLQGCTLGCPHCFNPETHATNEGSLVSVDDVFDQIAMQTEIAQGLTVTGGEPLQQAGALLELLKRIRAETTMSTLLFTGFSWDELRRHPKWNEISRLIDVVIAGRYEHEQRIATGLVGSANKTIRFLTDRYNESDLAMVPQAEIIVGTDGVVTLTGIDPLQW